MKLIGGGVVYMWREKIVDVALLRSLYFRVTKNKMSLTPYKTASLGEILYISFPLMLNSFSAQFMLFCDRIILSHYGAESMAAATTAGTTLAIFEFAFISIASITEVFVGQYNGAKRYGMIAKPVWQMVYFSLLGYITCFPFFFMGDLLIPAHFAEEGTAYFETLILFAPLYGVATALDAFYIGRGKTKFVMVVTVIANVINILLDMVFVFGIEDVLSPMGTKGAAFATGIATVFMIIPIAIGFFNNKNNNRFHTRKPAFDWALFKEMSGVGIPQSISRIIEISAWSFMFHYFAWASPAHVIVNSIGQTIFMLATFMSDALSKGVTTVASNLIGAKKNSLISEVLSSAFKIHVVIMVIIGIPLLFFPETVSALFLKKADLSLYENLHGEARDVIFYVWLFLLFDGFVWVFAGILTAGGDTRFIMLANSILSWCAAAFPAYVAIIIFHCSPKAGWMFSMPYALGNLILFWMRYRSGKWHQLDLSRKS